MSAKPMFGVPEDFRSAAEHAELMMAVAQPWNARDALDWPYRWLRFLGRFPFSYGTNLMASQTIDLRKAFPDDPSGFCGAYFRYWKRRKDVGFMPHGDGFSTSILSVVPIYEPELLVHQSRGAAALEQAFHEAPVDIDWIRPGRPSAC